MDRRQLSVACCQLHEIRGLRPRTTNHGPRTLRRGISLLEVLISMFVLLFGLMGVAAVFPVGNHFAGKGEQYDRGAALAEQAFADLKARGMLNPRVWMYADPAPVAEVSTIVLEPPVTGTAVSPKLANAHVIQPNGQFNVTPTSTIGVGHAFIIDPIGTAEAWRDAGSPKPITAPLNTNFDVFPVALFNANYPDGVNQSAPTKGTNFANRWTAAPPLGIVGNRWPVRRLTLPSDDDQRPSMTPAVAETIARLRDDVANETPEQDDRPGTQRWAMVDLNSPPTPKDPSDDTPLARSFAGNYSWIATIVPTAMAAPLTVGPTTGTNALQPAHPQFSSAVYDVSVAVFHKRADLPSGESERAIDASLNIGGELVIHAVDSADGAAAVDNAVKDLFPGQWVAVAGMHPTNGLFLLKWYKLQSLDDETISEEVSPGSGPYALRRAMLEGPDWPAPPAGATTVQNLRAIILPGVISVVTHQMTMERE